MAKKPIRALMEALAPIKGKKDRLDILANVIAPNPSS